MNEMSDLELLNELGVDIEGKKPNQYTSEQMRLITGFEDILKFAREHGRVPGHNKNGDIFERLYAVRLDRLRAKVEALELLSELDTYGLLGEEESAPGFPKDDKELLSELGINVDADDDDDDDITRLRHVSPAAHRRAAEEIAGREVCRGFKQFEPLFEEVRNDLKNGLRSTTIGSVSQDAIQVGNFFILNGQIAYIAEKGKGFKATGNNAIDARLRVIFDNGTESNLLMRSLQKALIKDDRGRTITALDAGSLFAGSSEEGDQTGTIYVLRTRSELPEILSIRDSILKIGVTGGDVKTRIAGAKTSKTYLLGEVEVVDEYKLYNINRRGLEKMLHRIFSDVRLNISIRDRSGKVFVPREWFWVTPETVNKAVELIKSGQIRSHKYDSGQAKFVKIGPR